MFNRVIGSLYFEIRPVKSLFRYVNPNDSWSIFQPIIILHRIPMQVDGCGPQHLLLEDTTGPSMLYKVGDGLFEVFRIENAHAVQYSMKDAPVEIKA